jgi:hypothetical protein
VIGTSTTGLLTPSTQVKLTDRERKRMRFCIIAQQSLIHVQP